MSRLLPGPRHALRRAAVLLCALSLTILTRAQTFPQPAVIPTGSWPVHVGTADLNGDGKPDLYYLDGLDASGRSTYHWLAGDGQGTFTPQPAGIAAWNGSGIAVADFLNSGQLQIATAYNVGPTIGTVGLTCSVAQIGITFDPLDANGNATGRYSAGFCSHGTQIPVIGNITSGVLHKGKPAELLFTDSANKLFYLVDLSGITGSTFSTVKINFGALPDGAGPIALADLNGDGTLDLAVAAGGVVNIFLTDRYGTPTAPIRFSNSSSIHSILLQDVTFDGIPDLIAEGLDGHIDVYPGNGDGTFSTTSIGGTGPLDGLTGNGGHLITLADLNHDGQVDALTATPAGISTLLGAGTSYLKLGGIYNAGPGHTSYAVADFNGDGNLDLAVDSPEGIAILYGNPDGSFQTSRAYAAGQPALSGALAAFTQSGYLDAVVSTAATQAQLLRGAGDGTFTAALAPTTTQSGLAGLWSTVQAADFNGDGNLDLLLTADGSNANLPAPGSGVPGIYLQYGDGTGNFSAPLAAAAPLQFTYPASTSCNPPFSHFADEFFGTSVLGDFNSDGLPDFANRDSAAYRILRGNNGSAGSSFTLYPTLYWSEVDGVGTTVDCNPHAHDLVATGDFNHDGHPDLIFQGSQANSGALLMYLSTPSGGIPLAGDLSGDGSLTTPGQLTAPNINPTFGGNSTTFSQPYFPGAIATADLDRDGNTDLLVTYANLSADPTNPSQSTPNYLYVWFGSGNGKFLVSAAHPVNPVRLTLSRNYYQVAVADLNHDGIPDLILSDGYLVSYQLGLGDGTFGPEHHLLAGRGINTLSTADLRNLGTTDLILANGGAALSNPVVNHEILAADPDVNTGGITVLLNTATPKTALQSALAASPEPSVYFSPYTVTATFTATPAPTGSVTFSENNSVLATVTLANGTASTPGAILVPGQYPLTATYSGDSNYPASTLTPTSHTITRSPTTTTLTPTTPLTVYYGQGIDGTFAVQVVDGTYPAIGNYTLLDNGTPVTICTNLPIAQSCPYGNPVLLDTGSHVFSIQYLGDAVNAPSTSPSYPYTILPDLTTVALTSNKNPANLGDAVTFTAIVTGNAASPTGTVNFLDNGNALGSPTLIPGPGNVSTAIFTTSTLAVGTHPITAVYPGTLDFNPAASTILPQVIQAVPLAPLASTTTLSSNLNPSAPQQLVTFTAQVQVSGVLIAIPTGTVTFLDGTGIIGTGTLNGFGIATFQTANLTTGTHQITATYPGTAPLTSATILPSTSPAVAQVVTIPGINGPAGFQMTATPTALTLGVGRTGAIAINITAQSGFNQPVALSCANLAPETTCVFLPSVVPAGGGSATLQLLTNAPRDCNSHTPYFLGSTTTLPRWPLAPGAITAALTFFAFRKRRRLAKTLLSATLAVTLTLLSGCGHCTDLGTRPGTYTFQLIGTAQGGPVTETKTIIIPLIMTIP